MNSVTQYEKWNPFKEMDELNNTVASLFGLQGRDKNGAAPLGWTPVVDITEDDNEYVITAEVPGIAKDQIKVGVVDGELKVSGERKFAKEDKKYHRVERAYGSFLRTFVLPEDANSGKVRAEFKDGILRIHLAKDEARKPKTIEVKVD